MALTQVTGPYPIFTDLDGTPLDDGYLYIGEINQDPEQNPIQVFWDSNLTIPATQPIRTSNGYAYRNGTPALLYTGGEFSITIRNKREEFVLYSPVGYGFDPAAVSASVVKNDFTGDGVEVDFTLSAAPSTILATNVFINGVYQEKDSYTLSGNVITFSIAPPLNSSIEVMTNETGVINSGNATAISYTLTEPGAVGQTVQTKLEQTISVRDFGAVGNGVADDSAAFIAALAASDYVTGVQGDTYFIDNTVTVVSDKQLIANGASIKGGVGDTSFLITGDNVLVDGWFVDANNGLYTFRNDGDRNTFSNNVFTNNVGHYIFNVGAFYAKVLANRFECESADTEVTTAVIFEACQHFLYEGNTTNGVPVGWGVQVRSGSQSGAIVGNTFRQFIWQDPVTATASQTVFNFTLGSKVNFKGVQVDGLPVTTGVTITGTGPSYTATFAVGRSAGEVVNLIGFRGAENIQLNTSSFDITVANNVINGTGDSGIVCLADRVTITGNIVKNAAYCGIALYGGQNNITVSNNVISECSLLDDGQSSPENPLVQSTFNGGIMVSGSQITVTGNVLVNDTGTMMYGVRVNTVDNVTTGDTNAAIKIGNNVFRGTYSLGRVYMPNDTSGKRVQNVIITDGFITPYPLQIDLDQAWTNNPPSNAYWTNSGFGSTFAIRDTTIKLGGTASLKTVAGEYVDFSPTAFGAMKNTIVKVSFWAKNDGGSSYCSLFSTLAGLIAPITVNITDTAWKQYEILAPFTDNLTDLGVLRFGANLGFANIQHINISMIQI
jgi:parallel beta-helix repeat protein